MFCATNFLIKVSKIFGNLLGHFEKQHFQSTLLGYVLGNFGIILGYFLFQLLVTLIAPDVSILSSISSVDWASS